MMSCRKLVQWRQKCDHHSLLSYNAQIYAAAVIREQWYSTCRIPVKVKTGVKVDLHLFVRQHFDRIGGRLLVAR